MHALLYGSESTVVQPRALKQYEPQGTIQDIMYNQAAGAQLFLCLREPHFFKKTIHNSSSGTLFQTIASTLDTPARKLMQYEPEGQMKALLYHGKEEVKENEQAVVQVSYKGSKFFDTQLSSFCLL